MRGCQECVSINLDAQWTALLEMASIVAWIGNGCRREASQTSIWPKGFSLLWNLHVEDLFGKAFFVMTNLLLKTIQVNQYHNVFNVEFYKSSMLWMITIILDPWKPTSQNRPNFHFRDYLMSSQTDELSEYGGLGSSQLLWNLSPLLQIQKLDPQKGLLCLLCWPFLSHTFLITSPSGAEFILLFRGNFSEPASTALLIETFSIESVKSKSWVKNLLGLNLCYITF